MIFLLIEFLDELVFGLQDAAWPLIRDDLHLNYFQIGVLLSVPGLIANLIEPFLFVLGDIWKRRLIILAGGVFFTLSLAFTAVSQNYAFLLIAVVLFNPASGAFVSLSQASLMDSEPERHESNMARWTFAGSLGVFVGPLILGGLLTLGFGWRHAYWGLAGFSALVLMLAIKRLSRMRSGSEQLPSLKLVIDSFRNIFSSLRTPGILRWLVLLEFSDLMLDVFYGFLALYFVDVAGFTNASAVLAVAIWTGVGLLGDYLLIPLVDRVRGLDYLRISVIIVLFVFPAFLIVSQPMIKLILVGLLGLLNSGWYAILRANLFTAMPGKSGAVLVLDDITGFFGRLLPLGIGLAAQAYGLGAAIWLLLLGPIALIVGLPRAYVRSGDG
jgi:FSR family fosmidomycin resistance protein-like MFS transporter